MGRILPLFLIAALTASAQAGSPQTKESQADSATTTAKYEGRTIASLEFSGNEHFISDFLRTAMLNWRTGRPFANKELKEELDRLRVKVFAARGYLRTEIGEPQIEEAPEGLNVTIPINEGRKYSVGEVTVEECTLLSAAEAIEILGLKRSEVLTGLDLSRAVERLKRFYGYRGYNDFNIDVDTHWTDPVETPDEGIADLIFKLEEGSHYCLGSVSFAGNTSMSYKSLRKLFRIQDGEPYNSDLIDQGVRALNRLEHFEQINPEDWKSLSSERNGQIDVVIPVKDKSIQQ